MADDGLDLSAGIKPLAPPPVSGDGLDLSAGLRPHGSSSSWDSGPTATSTIGVNRQGQPGALSRMWNWANRGLISPDTISKTFTGASTDELRQAAAGVHPEDSWAKNFARSALLGTGASAAEGISTMGTSPVGATTMVLGPLAEGVMEGSGATNALKATQAGRTALRAGRTAEVGTSAAFGAQGAQQGYEAATNPNLSPTERIAGAAGGLGQAILGGTGVAGQYNDSFLPTGVDAINRVTERPRAALADFARESGSQQMQRVLGPTTKENKAIAAKVAPEMAERGVMAVTRKGLEAKASAKMDEVGQQIDDFYQSQPAGTSIPTQPILDHFEQGKQAFMGSNGEVFDQGAIDRIDALKQVVQQFGPDVPVDDIVKLRRLWDGQVAQAKGFYGKTLAEGSAIEAKRAAAGAIREELAKQYPDLDKINKEYSFWANVQKVVGETNVRKASQAPPLGETVLAAGAMAKGGPSWGLAMAALRRAMTSTAWGTFSASTKFKIADLLADGNVTGAAKLVPPSGPPGPGGLPPTILNAPPTPPAAGAAGAATPPVPSVGPFARGAQPPPVAGEGTFRPATGTPEQAPLFTTPQAQTPTPAGNVAPPAPESPQGALQPLPVSPERAAQQEAALDDAATKIRGGQRDEASYNAMREAARVREMEPEYLRDVKQTRDLRQVDGKYTPEAVAAQDSDINKVLGPRKAPEAKPKAVIMVGGAASGKGGLGVQADNPGLPTIDSDVFKMGDEKLGVKGIPESKILLKSDPLGAADRMHEESSDIAKRAVKEAIDREQSFILDKVHGDPAKLRQQIQELKAAGYEIDLRGVDKNLDEAMNAMVGRARGTGKNGGRWVPTHVLEKGHIGAARAYHEAVPLLDPAKGDSYSLNIAKPAVEGGGYRGKAAFDLVADQNGVYNSVRYAEHRATKGGLYDGRYGLGPERQGLGGSQGEPPEVRAGKPQPPSGDQGTPVSGGTSGTIPTGEGTSAEQRAAAVPAQEQVVPSFLRPKAATATGERSDERHGLVSERQGLGGDRSELPKIRTGEPQPSQRDQRIQESGKAAGTLRNAATVPAQGQVGLHLADNAPPKNKPVILVQGGGYNPAHDGHVAAMQSAHDLLTGAGYTVDGHVVAPTADKLLAKKLGSDDRLSVEDRANIAKAAYPPEINGKPVEVQTGPAAEVEAMDRKPKRSDLAKNIQRQYPNHTVINVSGEDAGVPGAPANQPAALYQGDPGTSHEGINYITVPRVGGHSSTQIRNAYAAGEATLPGMNPEAERLYREAMGKKEAPPEPVSTARQDVQVAQGQRIAGHDGNETTVRTPTGDKYPGRYRVVEGDTLTPSHDPMTFAKNPNYPEGVQERAYHSSKEAQNRVIQQAQNYDPGYTVNTDPTGSNGPAIVTPDGTVLGGNSRVMSTDRLYRSGQGDVYKNELIKQAGQFGLDPEQIRAMKNPHLVREIEAPSSQEELRRIGKDLNRSMTGAPSVSERAVSAGKSLKPASLEEIGHMVDQTGEGASLREAMQKHGPAMLHILQRDGVITDRERPAMTDTSSTGGLNEDGKNFVEKALIGSVVEDPDLMSRTPKNVLNKLGSSLGDVASLAGRGDEYNITSLIRAALREHVAAAERGGPLEDHLRQQPMFGPERNPAVETMARALDGPVKNFRASLRSFAQDARADVPGQHTMLLTGKQSATDAFNHAFGTNLSEREFKQALHSALKEERHTGKL
jgi:hypothetical protein